MAREVWVTSDLHLGGGPDDPLEDFTADVELAGFIDALTGDENILVFNGDFLEFAQAPPQPSLALVHDLPSHLLWTSEVSVAKVNGILAAHRTVFDSLSRFANDRGGHVVITIGNHDLDLAFADVQEAIRQAIGDSGEVALEFVVGSWTHDDVLIEHGHHATPENCPVDPHNFLHDYEWEGCIQTFLERVWGTDFLLQWYNQFEQTHPYADNIKPLTSALYHGLRARPRLFNLRDFLRLLAFLKRRGLPRSGLSALLQLGGDVDIADIIGSIDDTAWQSALADMTPTEFQIASSELPLADRAVLAAPVHIEIGDPNEWNVPSARLGSKSRERDYARARLMATRCSAVVLGHTHREVDGDLGNKLFNPGTWIPRLDLDDPAVRREIQRIGFGTELLTNHALYTTRQRAVRITAGPHTALLELVTIH